MKISKISIKCKIKWILNKRCHKVERKMTLIMKIIWIKVEIKPNIRKSHHLNLAKWNYLVKIKTINRDKMKIIEELNKDNNNLGYLIIFNL